MDYWYTATETYDNNYEDGSSWAKYIEFSKLTHLTELISLDGMLNGIVFEPDRGESGDWDHIIVDDLCETGLFNSLDYVLEKVANKERFNLLTVVKEPTEECEKVNIPDFDFVGYELLDKDYSTSALSNCGGFDETFKPFDLNHYGLIDTFRKAYDIRERLLKNNPEEHHADCNVLALWRHRNLGRIKNAIGNEFIPGTKVSLENEFGVVLNKAEDRDLVGLIRWDTERENDVEDWRGLFGSFLQSGGQIVDQDYKFKFINDNGQLKKPAANDA